MPQVPNPGGPAKSRFVWFITGRVGPVSRWQTARRVASRGDWRPTRTFRSWPRPCSHRRAADVPSHLRPVHGRHRRPGRSRPCWSIRTCVAAVVRLAAQSRLRLDSGSGGWGEQGRVDPGSTVGPAGSSGSRRGPWPWCRDRTASKAGPDADTHGSSPDDPDNAGAAPRSRRPLEAMQIDPSLALIGSAW